MNQAVYILGGSQTDFARNWAREDLEIYDMFAQGPTCIQAMTPSTAIQMMVTGIKTFQPSRMIWS